MPIRPVPERGDLHGRDQQLLVHLHSRLSGSEGRGGEGRGGTSQDLSDSSHSRRVSALTRDSRVRAKMGDERLILLLSVTIALYINILTKFHLVQ